MINRYVSFWLGQIMKPKWIVFLCSGLTALIANPLTIQACSVCVTGAGDPTADAFNWSVLFLMATPYAVVGSIAGGLFFGVSPCGDKARTDGNDGAASSFSLE